MIATLTAVRPIISELLTAPGSLDERLQSVCDYIQRELPKYDWVGFYWADHDTKTLHLGPYAGEPTDHTEIPFGKGICGQVAMSNENFVVPDVTAQDNYIACSITVKAEIVVPIFKNGKNVGQIDIDSSTIDAFHQEDEDFLTWVCDQVSHQL